MAIKNVKEVRKEMFDKMEKVFEGRAPEEDIFFYHSSEERIVLTHALFWVMSASVRGCMAKEKNFLLLRQYQEEMLDAFLQDDAYFPELLRYCNILYNVLPLVLNKLYNLRTDKAACKVAAISVVAGGYGGDMSEELANELLDDMDYHYNKVKCRKIEGMMMQLNKMVENEMRAMIG